MAYASRDVSLGRDDRKSDHDSDPRDDPRDPIIRDETPAIASGPQVSFDDLQSGAWRPRNYDSDSLAEVLPPPDEDDLLEFVDVDESTDSDIANGCYESLSYVGTKASKETDEYSDFGDPTGDQVTDVFSARVRDRDSQARAAATYRILTAMVRTLHDSMRKQLHVAAPAGESAHEHLRRQVRIMVERAADEYAQRNYSSVIVALDVGMELVPHHELALQLIYRRSLSIGKVYMDFVGDLSAVPRLAVPMSALDSRDVDSRTAFVLSRIDGLLTVTEFLNVAGMPRFEAAHHLCMMVLKGVVELL